MRVSDAHRKEGKTSLVRASDIVRMAEHRLSRFGSPAPHSSVSGPGWIGIRLALTPTRSGTGTSFRPASRCSCQVELQKRVTNIPSVPL